MIQFRILYLIAVIYIGLTRAELRNDGCKAPEIITAEHGTISSPYYQFYPEFTSPANLKCRWSVTVPEGENIRVTFLRPMSINGGSMLGGGVCPRDWVAIAAGKDRPVASICSRTGLTVGPLCPPLANPEPPGPLVIAGNTMHVEFCTDLSTTGNYQGFELRFMATDEIQTHPPPPPPVTTTAVPRTKEPTEPPFTECGGEFEIPADGPLMLESPGYPNNYPSYANCVWIVKGQEGFGITVNFEIFQLEEVGWRGRCDYDTLTMTDLKAPGDGNMGIYCDIAGPCDMKTTGNGLKLLLHSDDSTEEVGFRLRIERSKCPLGSDVCPNAPANSPPVCFRPDQLCDGKDDCPGGTDENCPLGCGIPEISPILSTRNSGRIVGGIEVRPHSWPWQASMVNSGCRHFCGASIIDHHWIVTAAHCCDAFQFSAIHGAHTYRIRVGENDLNSHHERNAWTYDLERVIPHPLYDTRTLENDICLLKTKQPIFFNKEVHPICLGSPVPPPAGKDCFVTGWGDLEEDPFRRLQRNETEIKTGVNKSARNLRQVDVKVSSREFCNTAYSGKITEDMICAYNPGKDSCQGDSGGPFVCPSVHDPNTWELAGVVSWGTGCARPNIPGVYAKTAHFLKWITDTMDN